MDLRSGKTTKMADDKQVPESQTQPKPSTHTQAGDTTSTTPPDSNILNKLMELMGGINSKIDQNTENMNKKLEEMNENNNKKFEEVNENNNKKFEETKREIGEIHLKLEQNTKDIMESVNRKIEEKMEKLNENFKRKLEEKNSEFEGKMINLENKVEKINEDIDEKIHGAVKDLKTEISHEAEHLIVDGFTTIDLRIKKHEDTTLETTKELERKLTMNTQLLKDTQVHAPIYTNTQSHTTPCYFYGDNRIHPKIFLTRMKQYIDTLHLNTNIKPIIQSMIKGQAEFWYEIIEDKYQTFEDFECLILKQYWSEHTQQKIRFNLFNGKYNEDMGISRENYIMRKVYNIKYLEPEFHEAEIVRYLGRHFQSDIHNVIMTQRIITLDGLIEYLRGIDDYRVGWRKTAPRDNRQGDNRQGDDRQDRKYDNRQNMNRNYENVNRDTKYNNNNRNFNNAGRESDNNRNYNNTYRDNSNRNFNGQQRNANYYEYRNNDNTQKYDDRKSQHDRRENRTYAQVTNTNLDYKENGITHAQIDQNKIQTNAQVHTSTNNAVF